MLGDNVPVFLLVYKRLGHIVLVLVRHSVNVTLMCRVLQHIRVTLTHVESIREQKFRLSSRVWVNVTHLRNACCVTVTLIKQKSLNIDVPCGRSRCSTAVIAAVR